MLCAVAGNKTCVCKATTRNVYHVGWRSVSCSLAQRFMLVGAVYHWLAQCIMLPVHMLVPSTCTKA